MNRENFIKRCITLTAGAACMDLLLAGCASLPFVAYAMDGSEVVVRKEDFGEGAYVLLDVEALPAPVFVAKQDDEEYTAILLRCTHRGCQVQPAGDILECPCHGSRYTHGGTVIRGPAPDNLTPFPVAVDADSIRISLS